VFLLGLEALLLLMTSIVISAILAHKLGVSSALFEVIAGVLIGLFFPTFFYEVEWLRIFADIGLVFLMFVAGMEVSAKMLVSDLKTNLSLGIASFIVPFLTMYGFAMLFFKEKAFVLALATSSTAVGVTYLALENSELIKDKSAQNILAAAMINDVISLLAMSIWLYVILYEVELVSFIQLILVVIAVALSTHFARVYGNRFTMTLFGIEVHELDIKIACALACFLAIAVEFLGAHAAIGAFLAGLIIETEEEIHGKRLLNKVKQIGFGFFIPIFFVYVGILIAKFGIDINQILWMIIFAFIAILSRMIPLALIIFVNNVNFRNALAFAASTTPRLSVALALTMAILEAGILPGFILNIIVGIALITTCLAPVLTDKLHKKSA